MTSLPRFFLDLRTPDLDMLQGRVRRLGLRGAARLELDGEAPGALARLEEALGEGPVEILAHDAPFHQGLLEAWARREGRILPPIRWRCTLAGARAMLPGAPFGLDLRSLGGLLGWPEGLCGAEATARLWEALEAWKVVALGLGPSPGLVYLAGPFAGDGSPRAMARNREGMAALCRFAQGILPGAALVVPHLNFAFADEAGRNGAQVREQVLRACEALVGVCRALVLCGSSVTPGMAREIRVAEAAGLPRFTVPGWDSGAGAA